MCVQYTTTSEMWQLERKQFREKILVTKPTTYESEEYYMEWNKGGFGYSYLDIFV